MSIDAWMSFMGILSTIFAVFFVYSGFKIQSTVDRVHSSERKSKKSLKRLNNEIEFSAQSQYALQYMLSKQYSKAIDAFTVLRSEPFVLTDRRKMNAVYYFLAVSHYEQGSLHKDIEQLAKAVEYIHEAVLDDTHPLKIEINNAFESLDQEPYTGNSLPLSHSHAN